MKRIHNVLKEQTTREVAVNTVGNYLNIIFSAIYVVVIARLFSPADNGVYIVLFTLVYVFTNIFDFGTSATIYSYLPAVLTDKTKKFEFLKITFLYQTFLAGIALLILGIFITPLNDQWLKLHVPLRYFLWTFGTIPLLIWQNFVLNTLYASRRFTMANILINTINIVRLLILFLVLLLGTLNLEWLLIIFGPVGPILFFLLIIVLYPNIPRKFLTATINRQHLNVGYSAVFFVATQFYFVASRLDLFIIAHFLTKPEVGYYGLAQKIVFSILTTINSVTQVLSPQFAVAQSQYEIIRLMKRFCVYCLLPVALLIGAIVTPNTIYTFVFSNAFNPMHHIVRLLSGVHIFFVIMQIPMLFFLYTIKKPRYVLISNLLLLFIIGLGSYYGVQRFGLTGPPLALLISYLIVTLFAYMYFFRELRRLPKE